MKAAVFLGIAALYGQIGMTNAQFWKRHGHTTKHSHYHNTKREVAIAHVAVTETVTVTATDDSAIVWVDKTGSIVSTEYKTATSTKTIPSSEVIVATSSGSANSGAPSSRAPEVVSAVSPMAKSSTTASTASAVAAPSSTAHVGQDLNGAHAAGALGGFSIAYDTVQNGPCRNADTDISYLVGQGAQFVRVYGIGCPLGPYLDAAAKYNIKLMIGLNNIDNFNADINKLIGMVTGTAKGWAPVDTVYICNECVANGKDASAVAGAVSVAKGILNTKGFYGNVVCVDTFATMMANPTVCSSSSYCAINAHAYFDPNTLAENAGAFVRNAVAQVAAKNSGKRVVVTETGWPCQGSTNGKAIASPDAQRAALGSIMSEFASSPGDVYLFQAWSTLYKDPGALGVERSFGIFDSGHFNGQLR